MNLVRSFALKNEKVDEASRIVFLLPSEIHSSVRFVGSNILHEILNRPLNLLNTGTPNPILSNRINCHAAHPSLAPSAWRSWLHADGPSQRSFLPMWPRVFPFHIVLEAIHQLSPRRLARGTKISDGLPVAVIDASGFPAIPRA